MQEINVGDFLVSNQKLVWVVTDIWTSTVSGETEYVIETANPTDFMEVNTGPTCSAGWTNYRFSKEEVLKIGKIVPKDSEKLIEILFK